MKLVLPLNLSLFAVAAIFAGPTLADDMSTGAKPAPAAAPEKPAAMMSMSAKPPAKTEETAPAKPAESPEHSKVYKQCLKEKLAATDYFCKAHGDQCDAEKKGATKECRGEASGHHATKVSMKADTAPVPKKSKKSKKGELMKEPPPPPIKQ